MNAIKLTVMGFLLVIVLVQPIATVGAQGKPESLKEYIVIADTANLRSGPGTNFSVVGTVSKGDRLLVYDEPLEVSGWLRLKLSEDQDAYIADFLVEKAPMRYYPPDQEPIAEFSGRGRNITDVIDLPRGAYRVDAVIQDNSFILETIAVEGDCRDTVLFNEVDFNRDRLDVSALLVSTGCSLIFETDNVSGNWEFAIRDLLDADALSKSLLTIADGTTISGIGRTLTMATELPEGVWKLSAVVDDQAFILEPQVLRGSCSDFAVFNEIDFDVQRMEISTVYRSEKGGCTIFWEISNVEGGWDITFAKIR
ncbi:MAG: hypothetical protein Kow00106_18470 [Anaerolineae bacterium]